MAASSRFPSRAAKIPAELHYSGENVPFHPLILPERKVDVVIALDASADTEGNYPDGSAPFLTYTKTQLPGFGFTPFPAIPPPEDFVAAGLNARPSFFGCDDATPLIVRSPLCPVSRF